MQNITKQRPVSQVIFLYLPLMIDIDSSIGVEAVNIFLLLNFSGFLILSIQMVVIRKRFATFQMTVRITISPILVITHKMIDWFFW